MSEKRITTCDCGCKKRVTGRKAGDWLELSQGYRFSMGKDPIIEGTMHFSSLKCLQTWIANKPKKVKVK